MTFPSRIHEERGVVAVEFAIIATILVMLVFGIIELGRTYSQYEVFLNAARQGARKGAVRADKAAIIDAVDEAASGYEITPPISITVDDLPANDPPCNDDTVNSDLKVSWDQEFRIQIPFLPDFSPNVRIKGVFRCE